MKTYIHNILLASIALTLLFSSCKSTKEAVVFSEEEKAIFNQEEGSAHTIDGDVTEYEITIIDTGYYTWLKSIAKPEGYYSQSFMETRNAIYVTEWNSRVLQPLRYDSNLYELQISYDSFTDYGYDVNYQLYNYFIYFQRKYEQRLGIFVPRI